MHTHTHTYKVASYFSKVPSNSILTEIGFSIILTLVAVFSDLYFNQIFPFCLILVKQQKHQETATRKPLFDLLTTSKVFTIS